MSDGTKIYNIVDLADLTTDGFVKTSASDGTLIIDPTIYLASSSASALYVKKAGDTMTGDLHFGDVTNYCNLAQSDGLITWEGTYDKKLQLRPNLIDNRTKINDDKPSEVIRGCNIGYSFPIYNNDGEELYWKVRIPNRWCGDEDPQFGMCVTLAGAETSGNKFRFQLEWQTTNAGDVLSATTSSANSEQTVLTGRNEAYDTYFIFFNLAYADTNNPIQAGRMLQGRVRRVASASTGIANEVIVWDWVTAWSVDKVYSNWSVETNAT